MPLGLRDYHIRLLFQIVAGARVEQRFSGELLGADRIALIEMQTRKIDPEFGSIGLNTDGALDECDRPGPIPTGSCLQALFA